MKVTVPKVSDRGVQQAIRKTAENLGRRVHQQYDDLTGEWNDPPVFEETVNVRNTRTILEVKTTNSKYRWVTLGTQEHDIKPRPDNPYGLLIFQKNYRAGTTPRSLATRKPKRSGPTVFSKGFVHPGSEPRHFEIPIAEEQKPLVRDEMKSLLKQSVKIETESYGI